MWINKRLMSGGKILLRKKVIRTLNTLARIEAASFLGAAEAKQGRQQKDIAESRMKLLKSFELERMRV